MLSDYTVIAISFDCVNGHLLPKFLPKKVM